MEHEDERVEALLRQFQPRAPRALPAAAESGSAAGSREQRATMRVGKWAGVAAAAAAAIVAANLRFMPMADLTPDVIVGPVVTVNGMRGLLDVDAATLDRALLDVSKQLLPDVEAPESALGRLAQP